MAYLCLIHEELEMSIIQCTAPFRGENTPDEKKAFVDGHEGPIMREYTRQTGKKPVRLVTCDLHVIIPFSKYKNSTQPRPRTKSEGEPLAQEKEGEIRHLNYKGSLD